MIDPFVRASESDVLIRRSQILRAKLKEATDIAIETCRSSHDLRKESAARREVSGARA